MTDIKDLLEELSEAKPSTKVKQKPEEKEISQQELRDQLIAELGLDTAPNPLLKTEEQEGSLVVKEKKDKFAIEEFMDEIKKGIEKRKKEMEVIPWPEPDAEVGPSHDECMKYVEDRCLAGDEDRAVLRIYRDALRRRRVLSTKNLKKVQDIIKEEPLHKFHEKLKVYKQMERIEAELRSIVDDDNSAVRDHNEASNGLGIITTYYKKDRRLKNRQFAVFMRIIRKLKIQVD